MFRETHYQKNKKNKQTGSGAGSLCPIAVQLR